jgi:hypothetical protein
MKHKITLSNIYNYLEGNSQLILENLNIQPQHLKEQIAYRRLICKDDCMKTGKCIKCGCEFYGRTSTKESCNSDRFGELVNKTEWDKFKEINKIE